MQNVQIRRMFNRADKDGSGSLTKEEWHSVLNSSGCKTSMYEPYYDNDDDHDEHDEYNDDDDGVRMMMVMMIQGRMALRS